MREYGGKGEESESDSDHFIDEKSDKRGKTDYIYVTTEGLGMASYHLSKQGISFISYKNSHQKYDDGTNLLPSKYFLNASLNTNSRFFSGTIRWDSPVKGVITEKYLMVFSEDWSTI